MSTIFNSNRQAVRSTPNNLDKSTVISIFPVPIKSTKPTIQPGVFNIAAGSYEKPALLVVGSSSWWREIDEEQPLLEIPVSSVQVADSIVRDYCNGLLGCDMGASMPGLFWLPGDITSDKLIKEHKKHVDSALVRQKNFYAELVKKADVDWARTNGNPLCISDIQKLAAQELQLKDKPWLKDFNTLQLKNCVACGALVGDFPVCPNCKVIIDKDRFAKLGLQFA